MGHSWREECCEAILEPVGHRAPCLNIGCCCNGAIYFSTAQMVALYSSAGHGKRVVLSGEFSELRCCSICRHYVNTRGRISLSRLPTVSKGLEGMTQDELNSVKEHPHTTYITTGRAKSN